MGEINFFEVHKNNWIEYLAYLTIIGVIGTLVCLFADTSIIVKTIALVLLLLCIVFFYKCFLPKNILCITIILVLCFVTVFAFFYFLHLLSFDFSIYKHGENGSSLSTITETIAAKECPTATCNVPNNQSVPSYEFIDGKIHTDLWHSTTSLDNTYKNSDSLYLLNIQPEESTGLVISMDKENRNISNEGISTSIQGKTEVSFIFEVDEFSSPKEFPGYVFFGFSSSQNFDFWEIQNGEGEFIFFTFSPSGLSQVCVGSVYYRCENIANFDYKNWNVETPHKIKIDVKGNTSSLSICDEKETYCLFAFDYVNTPPNNTNFWISYYFHDSMNFHGTISDFEMK